MSGIIILQLVLLHGLEDTSDWEVLIAIALCCKQLKEFVLEPKRYEQLSLKIRGKFMDVVLSDGHNHDFHEYYFLKNGVMEGFYKQVWSNSTLKYTGFYKKGKKDGEFVNYSPRDLINSITHYKDDVEHGEHTSFYLDGTVYRRYNLNNGKIRGAFEQYHPNGKLALKTFFESDGSQNERKEYWANGALKISCSLQNNGKCDGEFKQYWEDGQMHKHSFYKNGEKHGDSKEYWKNGQLHIHNFYKDGKEEGECRNYYENGQLYERCFFWNGQKHGLNQIFSEEGKLLYYSSWFFGEKTGSLIVDKSSNETTDSQEPPTKIQKK